MLCASCRHLLVEGNEVARFGFYELLACDVLALKGNETFLCPRCGHAAAAELEHVTEPGCLVLELSAQVQDDDHVRQMAIKLFERLSGCTSRFWERTGADMLRVRIELGDDDENLRVLITSTRGLLIFKWSKRTGFMLGDDAESQNVVLNLQLNS